MVRVIAPITSPSQLLNLSTRMRVQTGENVMIGGFIITGKQPKRVIIRGIGPSLARAGVTGSLQDPTLELHDQTGGLVAANDNWKDTQYAAIQATGIPPTDDREAAIVASLTPGAYTAIEQGSGGTIGIGLVEIYDLDQAVDSRLANISTRGFVESANNVMIGGFIVSGNGGTIVARGIGPSLAQFGVARRAVSNRPSRERHHRRPLGGNLRASVKYFPRRTGESVRSSLASQHQGRISYEISGTYSS